MDYVNYGNGRQDGDGWLHCLTCGDLINDAYCYPQEHSPRAR